MPIGRFAGQTGQGNYAIAVGSSAGNWGQSGGAIALGYYAGASGQRQNAIAIGPQAGASGQGTNAIAIGTQAAYSKQGNYAIAIGASAGAPPGNTGQGQYSIAIGYQSYNTSGTIANNGNIILNASGSPLPTPSVPGATAFYVNPIRLITSTPASYHTLVYASATCEVVGVVSSAKSFVIDHPVDKDRYLVHTCLEGPEVGVYYRGKGEIVNTKFITIELPNYVDKLAYNFTVSVSGIFNETTQIISTYNASEVEKGRFRVYGPPGKFHWLIYGERAPVEVEPLKSSVEVKGTGPYKWIQK
jgi:hypothetical protein